MPREVVLSLPNAPGTYRIIDTSGRFYVGSASSLRARWQQHRYRLDRGDHPNPRLQAIWNVEPSRLAFTIVEVLERADRATRLAAEQLLLDAAAVGANPLCMNVLAIAGSHEGRKRSSETCAKLAEVNRGRSPGPEARAKMRAAKLGRKLSAAHRASIGAHSRGRPGPKHTAESLARWRRYTREQVHDLRRLHADGVPLFTIAKLLGIARATARRIIVGESYRDV